MKIGEKKEEFIPLSEEVKMYVCGPTVYDRAHIGNARSVVFFDLVFRVLRYKYPRVTYVRNFTDIDDKIIKRAKQNNETIEDLTQRTKKLFNQDMSWLNVLDPTYTPSATEYVGEMIEMIKKLVEKGFAYHTHEHVFFEVSKYKEHGTVFGGQRDKVLSNIEHAPGKHHPEDFVLWKPSTDSQPGYHSPWGRGRPGWHIECSAMSHSLLGDEFDIHGGGSDLKFPHHENEIAQSKSTYGGSHARYWIHNNMVTVNGKKMSKSLGNVITVQDLKDMKIPHYAIRDLLLSTHHTKKINITDNAIAASWRKIYKYISPIMESGEDFNFKKMAVEEEDIKSLYDDLNVGELHRHLDKLHKQKEWHRILTVLNFVGILTYNDFLCVRSEYLNSLNDLEPLRKKLDNLRKKAMIEDDFSSFDIAKERIKIYPIEIRVTDGDIRLLPKYNYEKLDNEIILTL